MSWIEITNEQEWESLLPKEHQSFLWTWAWGEAQRSVGKSVKRIVYKNEQGEYLFGTQAIQQAKFLFLHYWLLPQGPFQLRSATSEEADQALLELKQVFATTRFIRLEPQLDQFSEVLFVGRHAYHPAVTRMLDLRHSEEELLAAMHTKTRYNIRVAERHGVTVRIGDIADLKRYIELEDETAKRDGFVPLKHSYVEQLMKSLLSSNQGRLRLAEYNGVLLACSIEVDSADTTTYLFGASSSEHRDLMAPYALHWDAIKAAKHQGKHWYDLWGCNPEDEQDRFYKPRWKGISRFKAGFGGVLIRYRGTFDLPLKPSIYRLIQKIRSM